LRPYEGNPKLEEMSRHTARTERKRAGNVARTTEGFERRSGKKRRSAFAPAPCRNHDNDGCSGLTWRAIAVTISIVIMVIPVALGAPAMAVFVPPTMTVLPAIRTRFAQFGASVVGLPTLASMMLDSFMKTVIRFRNAPLAIVITGAHSWRACEKQESRQRRSRERYFSHTKNSRLKFRLHPVLLQILNET
jgi:hypothetical protein